MPSKHIKDTVYEKVTQAHMKAVLAYQRKIKDVDFLALCIEVGLREMTDKDIQNLIYEDKKEYERILQKTIDIGKELREKSGKVSP